MGTCKETLREKSQGAHPRISQDLIVSFGSPAAGAWKIPTSAEGQKAIQISIQINDKKLKLIQGHVKAITSINRDILARSFYTFPGVVTHEDVRDELCFNKKSGDEAGSNEDELFLAFSTNIQSDLKIHITATFTDHCSNDIND